MSFFKIFDHLRGTRSPEDPGRVIDIRPDDYSKCSVLDREDGLCLYELCTPEPHVPTGNQICFEIILHKELNRSPNSAFSVFRSAKLEDAKSQFMLLREKLPLLLQCVPELCTRDLVQDVVSLARSNTSWSLCHLAAHLGLVDVIKHPAVKNQINAVAADTCQTPLHVAIKAQKLAAVQMLVQLEANVEAVDANHDTMYHCAAITTKDIIKALSSKAAVNPMLVNRRNKENCTPLQLACIMDRADCVKELLKEGADVNSASAGPVTSRSSLESNSSQEDNAIPPRCLGRGKAEQNANSFQEEDMKLGGTPLHWAKSTLVLESMIEHGCDLNARNFQDNTALHIMVARNRLNCVILLLSYGADVNAIGMAGDTPLHVAARVAAPATDNWLPMFEQVSSPGRKKPLQELAALLDFGDVSILQALIVFGANVNALNGKGETPRHLVAASRAVKRDLVLYTLHAVGAARCTDDVPNCQDGCSSLGCLDGIGPEKPNFYKSAKLFDSLLGESIVKEALESLEAESPQRRGRQCRALALDGGGIRGLVIIRMMLSLEQIVERPFIQCFDWIAGTSTGGILALCLASGKTTAQCFQLYFRLKDKIFIGARPHDSDALEKFLKQELSEDLRMCDIPYPRLAITAVAAEKHPAKLYLFRNYKAPRQVIAESGPGGGVACGDYDMDPSPSELVRNVARATGAAPTYFKPYKQYLDGGLIANNPTLDLLTEIAEYNAVQRAIEADSEVADLTVMVSLGTGKAPVIPASTVDSLQISTGFLGAAKMAYGVQKLFQLVVDQATQTGGRVVERAQAWCHGIRVPYFRLNPETSEEIGLNETDNRILVKLLWESMVYMRNRREELKQLGQLLAPCQDSPSLQIRPKCSK